MFDDWLSIGIVFAGVCVLVAFAGFVIAAVDDSRGILPRDPYDF